MAEQDESASEMEHAREVLQIIGVSPVGPQLNPATEPGGGVVKPEQQVRVGDFSCGRQLCPSGASLARKSSKDGTSTAVAGGGD